MPHLILIGAGHAHMMVLKHLKKLASQGISVTAIGPSPYHYYSGMGPGMLAGIYTPGEIRFPVKRMVESGGGIFREDLAVKIDPQSRLVHLASGHKLSYDALSCNAGSVVPDAITQDPDIPVLSVKPISNLLEAREHLLAQLSGRTLDVAVVGGGPAALETAGGLWRLCADQPGLSGRITLYAGKNLLSGLPSRARRLARGSLKARGITIREDGYVTRIHAGRVELENGSSHSADLVMLALGIKPPALFRESGLSTGPEGGLAVNRFLQCTDHPEIFGGGDCIHFAEQPLDKVGVYAVRENPVLLENLTAFLQGRDLTPFTPDPEYLLIFNLGDGKGIFWKKRLIFDGKAAFWIKDWIDRRFMRRFSPDEAQP